MTDEHCAGGAACLYLESGQDVVSSLIEATEIVHDLADRFMYLPADDQRYLLILTSDRLRIAWSPIAVNQILNISTLQFHYMESSLIAAPLTVTMRRFSVRQSYPCPPTGQPEK